MKRPVAVGPPAPGSAPPCLSSSFPVPVAGIAAAAPSADALQHHILSFQQEINAIKLSVNLPPKAGPTYYRKSHLPRKGTWWRVYVDPIHRGGSGKQAGRLKGQGVSPYAAVERTGPEAAERPSSPPPPVERARPARERVTRRGAGHSSRKGRIFFPDMTSTEPDRAIHSGQAARQPPAAGPAERPGIQTGGTPPAVSARGCLRPKPASARLSAGRNRR
jgi:hypothetical protein